MMHPFQLISSFFCPIFGGWWGIQEKIGAQSKPKKELSLRILQRTLPPCFCSAQERTPSWENIKDKQVEVNVWYISNECPPLLSPAPSSPPSTLTPAFLSLPPSIASALTAPDSRRWNRNFDIKHLQRSPDLWSERPFDVVTPNLHHWEPGQRTRRHRGLKPESCHGTVKVKGLLDKNKPSNPTQGPRTPFDVGNTEKE